jgi:hypothetical protein
MSPSRLADPDYWRSRAEEARTQADQMRDPTAQRTLLGIAANYDQLAEQAEAHVRSAAGVAD